MGQYQFICDFQIGRILDENMQADGSLEVGEACEDVTSLNERAAAPAKS